MSSFVNPNTIAIHGEDYLLAWVGNAAHLVSRADDGQGRPIVDHFGAMLNPAYEPTKLTEATWSQRTLCGRDEWVMCATEAGRGFESIWNGREAAVVAPTCKRCLRILDKQFPPPPPDQRLDGNVMRAVEELEQWGCLHVWGVPGEQIEVFRKSLRAQARLRGWRFQSSVFDGQLVVSCPNALSPERDEFVTRESMERMRRMNSDQELPPPSWRFAWS